MNVLIRGALQQKFVCVHAYYQNMETWHNPWDAFFVQLPQDQFSTEPKKSSRQDITCICFSPSEEMMVVSTNKNQLYMFTMFSTKLIRVSAAHSTAFMSSIVMIQASQCCFLWCILIKYFKWTLKTQDLKCSVCFYEGSVFLASCSSLLPCAIQQNDREHLRPLKGACYCWTTSLRL